MLKTVVALPAHEHVWEYGLMTLSDCIRDCISV